jgi:hypothetical protein
MKIQAVKDADGGYRVKGTNIIWARLNECRCCWYIFDQDSAETIAIVNGYKDAKATAFEYFMQEINYPEMADA